MPVDDDYTDTPIIPAVKYDEEGVHLYTLYDCLPDCEDYEREGEHHVKTHVVLHPEMAREIAFHLTKASIEFEQRHQG